MQAIVVNGNTMAPIRATQGDRIVLQVKNRLSEPVLLHFHGIPHHGTHSSRQRWQRQPSGHPSLRCVCLCCQLWAGVLTLPRLLSRLLPVCAAWLDGCLRLVSHLACALLLLLLLCAKLCAGSYTYNLVAATAGSYWWHADNTAQALNGLWGPFIVRKSAKPVYAADSVVAVSDW